MAGLCEGDNEPPGSLKGNECQDSSSHSLKMALRSVAARVARSVRSTLEADGSEALLRTVSSMAASRGVVPVQEAKRFMVDAMTAVGTLHDHAEQLADVLVAADYKGHFSHGLNRLGARSHEDYDVS
ncbi:hypothetical protein ANN_10183 [Periplaneta americana]|uniref:Uncharacterized protein n=1 Tax=Periplaneta americana TaxID=6978 RepID=A0ABQ8TS71_PERAM|nr:hypothetical protein ANN_10183 [Periplaneta americana]